MNYFLKDGNKIPKIGLGTWKLKNGECVKIVQKALELGYKHIDTAEMYGNQREIGVALKDFDRTNIFLTSKVWFTNLCYDDVLKSCNNSLKELNIDYLDLLLIHWPNRNIAMEETFRALKKFNVENKVRSIGVSNFTINHLKDALKVAEIPISINQVEFHPHLYQKKLLDFCKQNKIVITAYAPLARGRLFNDKFLISISKKYNRSVAQICLRWSMQKGVVVIPKASSEVHLRENLDIFDWEISNKDMEAIDSLTYKRFMEPEHSDFNY